MTQSTGADYETDQAMAVLRAMVAIADSTVQVVVTQLTLTQFRALRTVAEKTPTTMSAVAQELAINPSTVTRAGEKLVQLGLLQRARNPLNKREILLAPTPEGRRVVERVGHERRRMLESIMRRLDDESRRSVAAAFEVFASAAAALPTLSTIDDEEM